MKRTFFCLTALLLSITFSACNSGDSEGSGLTIGWQGSYDGTYFRRLNGAEQSFTAEVYGKSDWIVYSSSYSDVTVTPKYGQGLKTISISISKNESGSDKSHRIYFNHKGESYVYSISQSSLRRPGWWVGTDDGKSKETRITWPNTETIYFTERFYHNGSPILLSVNLTKSDTMTDSYPNEGSQWCEIRFALPPMPVGVSYRSYSEYVIKDGTTYRWYIYQSRN